MSSIDTNRMAEPYIRRKAIRHLEKKRVVIFAGGTGNPFFTTDTAAALRANEVDAEVLMKATKVDGIYDKDPVGNTDAVKIDKISFLEVINRQIKIMDSTAVTLCMDSDIDIIIFNIFEKENMSKVINGEKIGSIVTKN